MRDQNGFTLLELSLIVGMILILTAAVFVAINPPRRFAEAHNTERRAEITAIANAIDAWATDTGNYAPTGLPASEGCIGTGAGCYDLTFLIPKYFPTAIPQDPKATGGQADIGYKIYQESSGAIVITAPLAELGEAISVTRK